MNFYIVRALSLTLVSTFILAGAAASKAEPVNGALTPDKLVCDVVVTHHTRWETVKYLRVSQAPAPHLVHFDRTDFKNCRPEGSDAQPR